MLSFNEYQKNALSTAIYPKGLSVPYCALGLAGEAGEVANKVKKIIRDQNNDITTENVEDLKGEIGDVLWYCATLAHELGLGLDEIAAGNLKKLQERQARGKISGAGDKR
jgi:NTP pyrophosphatase (non-canonical NTP hydrolase)